MGQTSRRKKRIDQLLVARGLVATRAKAQALLLAGHVLVNEQKVEKPGRLVPEDAAIRLLGDGSPYVSRGGVKLAHALDAFHVTVAGRVALDIGISTGGFTDCLLQCGARTVWGVDVGYGQLAWSLRQDPRVRLLERTNARTLTQEVLYGSHPDPSPSGTPATHSRTAQQSAPYPEGAEHPAWADLCVMDVSFISVLKIFPVLRDLLLPPREAVVLVKPQFEADWGDVPKGGVIQDAKIHEKVRTQVREGLVGLGWQVLGECDSPITGGDGNCEFFFHLKAL